MCKNLRVEHSVIWVRNIDFAGGRDMNRIVTSKIWVCRIVWRINSISNEEEFIK